MSYRPTKKVLAAAFFAVIATVFLVVNGDASLATVTAVWTPIAAAYVKSN